MAIARVQARGQVTLPKEVREAAGVEPGDAVIVEATGRGRVELRVVPRLTLAETFERYRIDGPIDLAAERRQWEAEAADRVLEKAAVVQRRAKRR
jgi:AbrB family looped-hinge helix DNA binding protein